MVVTTVAAAGEVKLATELINALNQKGKPYVECAFAKMERTHQIISVPWARAQL